jgi:DNA (cytosine-5)-methyltransferase 1
MFSGAGGSSWGARLAGVEVIAGFDAWEAAKYAFTTNFCDAKFYHSFLENLDPSRVKRSLGAVDLILASPECTSHSPAKGSAERSEQSRSTALQVVRFAKTIEPRWIVVENVVSMRRWSGYKSFKTSLEDLGYNIREQVLNAADFGVPQRRRRLFLLCDKEATPPQVEPTRDSHTAASTVIEEAKHYPVTPLRTSRRASATLARADRAMAAVGHERPFLLVYYGSDKGGGWQSLSTPLRTITTLDRFGLVLPGPNGHVMRMLQVPELKRAMGMPGTFELGEGSRRERIHLIGNAVCPPVMRAVVRTLTRT